MRTKNSGFTLIEILMVMAVLGLVMAAVMTAMTQRAKQESLRQSAVQLSSDISKIRNQSIKLNTNTSLLLTSTGYRMTVGTVITDRTWPNGVSINNNGTTALQYTAPLTQSTAGAYWILSGFGSSRTVRVIGVTGRAYESAN